MHVASLRTILARLRLNHFNLHFVCEEKSYLYNLTSVFPLEKRDEPKDEPKEESKDETKDEPLAEPDKVFITWQYLKDFP